MVAKKIPTLGMVGACALLSLTGPARADSLTLSCQLLSPGSGTSCPAAAPALAVPGAYNYVDSFRHPTASGSIAGSDIYAGSYGDLGPAGFIDDYFFQISSATSDDISVQISDKTHAISNLFARLYSLSANPGGLALTQPAGTVYYGDIMRSAPATLVQIDPITLAAGSYVLEISGTASGSLGGSYTGTLNLSPVPLPASFPLLLAGLLGFAGLTIPRARRR